MADLTATTEIRDIVPAQGMKLIGVKTPATADVSDTIKITLGSIGIATDGFVGIFESIHSTEDSVLTQAGAHAADPTTNAQSTTAVASGVLTITLGTLTNKAHGFLIVGTGPA